MRAAAEAGGAFGGPATLVAAAREGLGVEDLPAEPGTLAEEALDAGEPPREGGFGVVALLAAGGVAALGFAAAALPLATGAGAAPLGFDCGVRGLDCEGAIADNFRHERSVFPVDTGENWCKLLLAKTSGATE